MNIAIALVGRHRVLLVDAPTAALDAENRAVVVALLREKLEAGAAILAIFHDEMAREALATRYVDVTEFTKTVGRAA